MSLTVLAVGAILPFLLLHFGVFAGDEQYQILNAINYRGNAAAPLSSFLTNLWGQVFGFSMVSMRTLAACLSTVTVMIGVWHYHKRICDKWNTIMMAGLCLLLSATYQVFSYAIGWDVFANLFTVVTLAMLLRYFDNGGRGWAYAAIIGALAALATASRLPSGIILPLSVCLLFFTPQTVKRKVLHATILMASYAAVLLAVLLLIFGSMKEFVGQCGVFLQSGMGDDHGSIALWLLDTFNEISTARIPEISVMLVSILTFRFADLHKWGKLAVGATILFFAAVLIFIFHGHKYLAVVDNLFIIALTFTFAIVAIYQNSSRRDAILTILTCVVFSFVSVALSNVRTTKILAAPILPIILSFVTFSRPIRRVIVMTLIFAALFWCRSKYLYGWFDYGVGFTHIELTIPHFEGIYTTEARAKQFSDIYNTAERINGEYIVGGRGRYFVEYATGHINVATQHYFYTSLNDKKYVDAILRQIDAHPVTLLVIDAENFTTIADLEEPLEIDNNSLMQQELERRGYIVTDSGEYYRVYSPTPLAE